MNKISMLPSNSLREDYKFLEQLESKNLNLQDSLWSKFCIESENERIQKKFQSHPKRIFSDTESSLSNSPRPLNLAGSSASNVNLTNDDRHQEFMNNQNNRRKLHSKLTINNHYEDVNPYNLEVNVGDGDKNENKIRHKKESECNIFPIEDSTTLPNHFPEEPKPSFIIRTFEGRRNMNSGNTNKRENRDILKRSRSALTHYQKIPLSTFDFVKKFNVCMEKCLHVMNDTRIILEKGIPPPDGDEDYSRRISREKEFFSRFSRNYLYPLARQMDELGQVTASKTCNKNIHQRIISTYQLILQGLQAYHNHLHTSVDNCSSDKLKTVLHHLLNLCHIHSKFVEDPDVHNLGENIHCLKMHAELMLEKLDDFMLAKSTDSVLKSNNTKTSLTQFKGMQETPGKQKKTKLQGRFSMYTTTASFRKDAQFKRAVDYLAKRKCAVKSKYKTATFKHRPPVEKPHLMSLPSKSKLFPKRSSGILKNTPIDQPENEDNITTMVQVEKNKEQEQTWDEKFVENNNNEHLNHRDIVLKLLQLVQDKDQEKQVHQQGGSYDTGAIEKVTELLKQFLKGDQNKNVLTKLVSELHNEVNTQKNALSLEIINSKESVPDSGSRKTRKQPVITESGEKNARLICIRDDNSIAGDGDSDEENVQDNNEEFTSGMNIALKTVTSSETQTDLKLDKKMSKSTQKTSKTSIKISRLPKFSRPLHLLPKNYAINIIQYKLEFHKHSKDNPMYRKTSDVRPWILMGKISDEILNYAVLTVAQEIELNDIVEKIYQSELQL